MYIAFKTVVILCIIIGTLIHMLTKLRLPSNHTYTQMKASLLCPTVDTSQTFQMLLTQKHTSGE